MLRKDGVKVVVKLFLGGADVPDTARLVTWATSTTKDLTSVVLTVSTHLQNIKHRKVDECTSAAVVDRGTFNHDSMSGQIDTPSKCRSTAENLDAIVLEHALHHRSVASQHTGMVDTEASVEKLLHLPIARRADFLAVSCEARMTRGIEVFVDAFGQRHLSKLLRRADSLLARMNEDHDLVTVTDEISNLVKDNLLHVPHLCHRAGFTADSNEVLLERDGTERRVKVKEAFVAIHTEEVADVNVIGKSSTEADNANQALG